MHKVPTTTEIVTDFITKVLLNSLQMVIDRLLTSLQLFTSLQTIIDLLLMSLQLFTYFITNCY